MPFLGNKGVGARATAGFGLGLGEVGGYGPDRYLPGRSGAGSAAAASAERTCGAASCANGWVKPWKSRTRPIFEGEWGCGERCLESMVRAAVRREAGDGLAVVEEEEPHRHRVPLGLVMLQQGWITHPQLQTALAAQRATGRGRIGEWLAKSCGVEEEQITRGLGLQWNCPVLAIDGFSPAAMALVMPKRFVAEFGLVPLRPAGSSLLYLAFADQMDAATALGVEQMSGVRVESGLLNEAKFEGAKASLLAAEGVPMRMANASDADALTGSIVKTLREKQPVAARLVRVHQYYWLRVWLESGAMGRVGTLPAGTADVEDALFTIGSR